MQRFAAGFGIAVLALCWANAELSSWVPFATDYRPHGFGWMVAGGCCALIGTYVAGQRLPLNVILAASMLGVIGLAAGTIACGVYHAHHTDPLVPDGLFGHLERRAAFHRQLAVPAFTAVVCGTAILWGAWRSRRPRTLGRSRPW